MLIPNEFQGSVPTPTIGQSAVGNPHDDRNPLENLRAVFIKF
jgi:hypothetical protein